MPLSTQHWNLKEIEEWKTFIIQEQRLILANTHKNPIQKLIDVFELFISPFPVDYLKQIGLYENLLSLSQVNRNNPTTFLKENASLIRQTIKIFEANKTDIRQYSVELYYSLLDFKDFLKCNGIYYYF